MNQHILSYADFLTESSDLRFSHKVRVTSLDKNNHWASMFHVVIHSAEPEDAIKFMEEKIGSIENHVFEIPKSVQYGPLYIPKPSSLAIGVYNNGDSVFGDNIKNTDRTLTRNDVLKEVSKVEAYFKTDEKRKLKKAERLLTKYNIKKIEGKRKERLYKRAIEVGNEMYGDNGTHGGHFRFAKSSDKLNVYELSEKDFNRLSHAIDEFISVNHFIFYLSNRPGQEEWYLDDATSLSPISDMDGNVYIADDYDSILDNTDYSSIFIVNTGNQPLKKKSPKNLDYSPGNLYK